METMADRIRTRRVELGLRKADLAAICGVSPTGVGKWERGATHNLKGEHLFNLADALNVNARWLALGDGEKVANSDREAYHFAIEKSRKAIDREQTAWHRIAAAFSRAAILAMVLVLPSQQEGAAGFEHNANSADLFSAKSLTFYTFRVIRWIAKLFGSGQLLLVKLLQARKKNHEGGIPRYPLLGSVNP